MHEEALACELAAYFYLETGEVEKAREYFLLAYEKYHEWVSSVDIDFYHNMCRISVANLVLRLFSSREQLESAQVCSSSLRAS